MAESLGEWIARAILKHDTDHGANLEAEWKGKRFCQVVQFDTYRTKKDPHAEVRGIISDKTHWVKVVFDVASTDKFEETIPGVPFESLTSQLRAVLSIQEFKFRLLPPTRSSRATLPNLELYITKWDSVVGDANDPVFFPQAVEVGKGAKDGDVKKVLRKWYYGESNSDPAQIAVEIEQEQPVAGPSRHRNAISRSTSLISTTSTTGTKQTNIDSNRLTLLAYVQRDFDPTNEKKSRKPIPDSFFEIPDDQRRLLDEITFFGLELSEEDPSAKGGEEESDDEEAVDWSPSPERVLPPATQEQNDESDFEIQITQSDNTATPKAALHPKSSSSSAPPSSPAQEVHQKISHTDSESEDDIPIKKPYALPKPTARRMFDLHPASSPVSIGITSIFSEDLVDTTMRAELSPEKDDGNDTTESERETKKRRLRDKAGEAGLDGEPSTMRKNSSHGSGSSPSLPASQHSLPTPFSSAIQHQDPSQSHCSPPRQSTPTPSHPITQTSPYPLSAPTQILVDDSESAEKSGQDTYSLEAQQPRIPAHAQEIVYSQTRKRSVSDASLGSASQKSDDDDSSKDGLGQTDEIRYYPSSGQHSTGSMEVDESLQQEDISEHEQGSNHSPKRRKETPSLVISPEPERESSTIPSALRYLNPLRIFSPSKAAAPISDTHRTAVEKEGLASAYDDTGNGEGKRRDSILGFLWGRGERSVSPVKSGGEARGDSQGKKDSKVDQRRNERITEDLVMKEANGVERPTPTTLQESSKASSKSPDPPMNNPADGKSDLEHSTPLPVPHHRINNQSSQPTPPSSGRLAARTKSIKSSTRSIPRRSLASISTDDQESATTTMAPIQPIEEVKKLGGFKPNLSVEGLSEDWVMEYSKLARLERERIALK